MGPYAPQGSRKLRKWKPTFEVCTTVVLDSMKLPTSVAYGHGPTGEVNSNSYVLATSKVEPDFRPMHTKFERCTFKVTDNFGSNGSTTLWCIHLAPAVLGVLYACVLYFCICTCSA